SPVSGPARLPVSLYVRLGPVPVIRLGQQKPVTDDEAVRIRQLIASLASVDSPNFGLSSTMSGAAFAPVAGSEHAGMLLLTDHRLHGHYRRYLLRGGRADRRPAVSGRSVPTNSYRGHQQPAARPGARVAGAGDLVQQEPGTALAPFAAAGLLDGGDLQRPIPG